MKKGSVVSKYETTLPFNISGTAATLCYKLLVSSLVTSFFPVYKGFVHYFVTARCWIVT